MPATVTALIIFFCFVTPGLVFELLQERSRPARTYSALRETSLIVVASVCFSVPGIAVLLVLARLFPAQILDLRQFANGPANYAVGNMERVFWVIVATMTLAIALAFVANLVIRRFGRGGRFRENPTWYELIHGEAKPTHAEAVLVSVELKNGSYVNGAVKGYSFDPDQSLQTLVLCRHTELPLSIRDKAGQVKPLPDGWGYLVVAGSEIRTASVAYSRTET
jgi:hypothetical protein